MIYELILFLHAAATAIMAGLIWFVQVVHYPLMARVGSTGNLAAYSLEHQQRTTRVVALPMLTEAVTAVWITIAAFASASSTSPPLAALGLLLLIIIWASTFFVQVPLHTRLANASSPPDAQSLVRTLVRSNWLRTAAWSARLVMALLLLRG